MHKAFDKNNVDHGYKNNVEGWDLNDLSLLSFLFVVVLIVPG